MWQHSLNVTICCSFGYQMSLCCWYCKQLQCDCILMENVPLPPARSCSRACSEMRQSAPVVSSICVTWFLHSWHAWLGARQEVWGLSIPMRRMNTNSAHFFFPSLKEKYWTPLTQAASLLNLPTLNYFRPSNQVEVISVGALSVSLALSRRIWKKRMLGNIKIKIYDPNVT